jgi:hypothetical protein
MKKTSCAAILVTVALSIPGPKSELEAQAGNAVFDPGLYSGLQYRSIGPSRGGRVTAVTGVAS